MEVAVAAWVGSPNAGDELVHAGLRRHLAALGATATVPGRAALIAAVACRRVDGLVLGGGGLLQDETSGANLPYHLSPSLAARVPAVGVGLGAGPLTTALGRRLTRAALARAVAVSVRDAPSADLLAQLGLARPAVTADLAFALPRPEVEVEDVVVAAFRPWTPRRHRLPVALRRRSAALVQPDQVERAAAALDAVAERTGLGIRLVALEPPKDAPLLRAIADRLRAPTTVVEPAAFEVPDAVGSGRVVLAMRYHAGVGAALAGRPAVLLGYSPKVAGLAADLGSPALPWDLPDPGPVADAVVAGLARSTDELDARLTALLARERGNVDVLEQLAAAAESRQRRSGQR